MKKLSIHLLFSLIIILLSSNILNAVGINGGEITWTCLGNDSILIKVVAYKDCTCNNNLNNLLFKIECNTTNQLLYSKSKVAPVPVDITPVCPGQCNRCTSSSCPNYFGYKKYTFYFVFVLNNAGSCCELRMSFSHYLNRCGQLTTGMSHQAFYVESIFNKCDTPCNSSPQFMNDPINLLCVYKKHISNIGVYDPENDSISIGFTEPLKSHGQGVNYSGSYSYQRPLYFWGFPNKSSPFPKGLHLNSQTGELKFTPVKIQRTCLAIKVKEYKNGQVINTVTRDIQLNIFNCPPNNNPMLSGTTTKEVCANSTITFQIYSNDLDYDDSLSLIYKSSIPNASWITNNAKHPMGVFTWTPDNSFVSSQPYTFTVQVFDNHCPLRGQITKQFRIFVKAQPKANLNITDLGCGKFNFSATPIKASSPTYLWIGPDAQTRNTKQFSVRFRRPGNRPYSLTIFSSNGCSNTYFDTLNVDSFIFVNLPKDTILCAGNSISIPATIKYAKGNTNLQWNTGDTINTQITLGPLYKDSLIKITVSDTTGCSFTDSMNIDIKNIKLDLGDDIRLCYGKETEVIADIKSDIHNSNVTIKWFTPANPISFSKNDSITLSKQGVYFCQITDTFGCFDIDTFNFHINKKILAHAKLQLDSICYGNENIIFAVPTGGDSIIYDWYKIVDTNKQFLFSNISKIVSPDTSINYLLHAHESNYNVYCEDFDTVFLKVNKLPEIYLSQIPNVCIDGNKINLNKYSIPQGGKWLDKNNQQIPNHVIEPSTIGTGLHKLKYKYTDAVTLCENSDTVNLLVNPLPNVVANTFDGRLKYCETIRKISLKGQPSGGNWEGTGISDTSFNAINKDGIYKLIYHFTDSNFCYSNDSIDIEIVPKPEILIDSNYEFKCFGDTFSLSLHFNNADEFSWKKYNSSDGDIIGNLKNTIIKYLPGKRDYERFAFYVSATTKSLDPTCKAVSDSMKIEIKNLAFANFNAVPIKGCEPLDVYFSDSTKINGKIVSYYFNYGDSSISNTKPQKHTYKSKGIYDVKYIVTSESGCSDTIIKNKLIEVYEKPNANFITEPKRAYLSNSEIQFVNQSVFTTKKLNYLWNFGDSITHETGKSQDKNPIYKFTDTGTFICRLIIENEYSCRDTAFNQIIIDPDFYIYIPSAFSPNNDGLNDEFSIVGSGINNFKLTVFNRWGEMVYHSEDYKSHGWNGKFKSDDVPLGVYVYIIQTNDKFGKNYKYSGNITLVR